MKNRLGNLKKSLPKHRVDAFLISSVSHISYLTGFSHFSTEEREAYLLVTRKKNYIFTDGRYSEAVKKEIKNCALVELGRGVSFGEALGNIKKTEKIRTLGIEENDLTVSEFRTLQKAGFKTTEVFLESLRIIKEDWEVKHILAACRLSDQAFDHVLKKLKTGVSEKEIAWEMELFIKSHGGQLGFESIVAFGKNSSVPHHHTGETQLGKKDGSFILLDFGARVRGYRSDMTRTIFWGKASEKQKKIYQAVFGAQKKAEEYITNNISKTVLASEVDRVSREYIKKEGFSDIPHSLGHGIGLEVHEAPYLSPRSKHGLERGMVFSIEPGIYTPGFGGVRIEDLYLLQKKNLKQLTGAKKGLIEL